MYDLPPDADDDNRDGVVDGIHAYQQWLSIPAKHKHAYTSSAQVPRGALMFWAAPGHKMGHVAIALGGGRVRTTWNDLVLTHTIDHVNSRGYHPLGWTDYLCDTPIEGILPVAHPEEDIMAKLPALDWRRQSAKYDPWTARIQGLLAASGHYKGKVDGLRGPLSIGALADFQIATNSGDGKGKADKRVGSKTWESMLTGRKWSWGT